MSGAKAFRMDFSTTCKPERNWVVVLEIQHKIQAHSLGTPETNFNGRRTRMALKVRKSTPSSFLPTSSALVGSSELTMVM